MCSASAERERANTAVSTAIPPRKSKKDPLYRMERIPLEWTFEKLFSCQDEGIRNTAFIQVHPQKRRRIVICNPIRRRFLCEDHFPIRSAAAFLYDSRICVGAKRQAAAIKRIERVRIPLARKSSDGRIDSASARNMELLRKQTIQMVQ